MASQQLILGLIAIAILVILLIPTLVIKTRKERKLPGEPKPTTRGRRFCALLIDVICVSALNGIGWGLFVAGTALYELSDIAHKPAIESATKPIGTALLLAISIGYVIISVAGRLGSSPGTNAMGAAFILSVLGKTWVGMFASIGIIILFLEAVSVLWDERGIIAKVMHLHLVDTKATTTRAQ
ncbi:MAG: RDD family protein [Cutibacterium avidum]|nr:RDD family protein [Cutibacterium avidum]